MIRSSRNAESIPEIKSGIDSTRKGTHYGSCWGNEIAWSQAAAAADTWYAISDSDMADGQLKGITHDGSGQLTVSRAGIYSVRYASAVEISAPNKHVQTGILVGGAAQNDGINHIELATANAQATISGNAILSLAAGAAVSIGIRTTDTGTPNLSIDHLNFTLIQVGP